jgi:hypothetical protein
MPSVFSIRAMAAGVIALPLDHVSQRPIDEVDKIGDKLVHETRSAALPPFSAGRRTRGECRQAASHRGTARPARHRSLRGPPTPRARNVRPVTWQSRSSPWRSRRRRGPTLGKVPLKPDQALALCGDDRLRTLPPIPRTSPRASVQFTCGRTRGTFVRRGEIPCAVRCEISALGTQENLLVPKWCACCAVYATRREAASVSFASTLGARCANFASCSLICAIFGGYQNGN